MEKVILGKHANDVAAATAAYALNVMPEIIKLPAPEYYRRLKEIILTAIEAYEEFKHTWAIPPMPSDN